MADYSSTDLLADILILPDYCSRMISVNGLTKQFGTQLAVDGLSFEARAGEIVGFLGLSRPPFLWS